MLGVMTRVWGPSFSAVLPYTSWLYRMVPLESGERVNLPTFSPSIEKEMSAGVMVPCSVFGRMLNTYTADPVNCTVIVAEAVPEGRIVVSCQVSL